MTPGVYLEAYLAPLAPWLERPDVTDILINAPGEVWIETLTAGLRREAAEQLTEQALQRLARQIAAHSSQAINREQPLLSATLPDGSRVQVVSPPATRGGVALALRKHVVSDLSLDELARGGLFATTTRAVGEIDNAAEAMLQGLLDRDAHAEFLKAAVRLRKTVVISGGTGTGKTTLLNALVKEIPPVERLIVIEDAPEICLHHDNAVGLIAVRGDLGEAQVDADSLLAAALRMRPERILLGELRGREAFAYLRAVNSGHPGSITTVHADTPAGALDQIALLAMMSGVDLGWDKVKAYVAQVVDVVVQLERVAGSRRISKISYRGAGRAA